MKNTHHNICIFFLSVSLEFSNILCFLKQKEVRHFLRKHIQIHDRQKENSFL